MEHKIVEVRRFFSRQSLSHTTTEYVHYLYLLYSAESLHTGKARSKQVQILADLHNDVDVVFFCDTRYLIQ